MKIFKTIITALTILLSTSFSFAQSSVMKDPVSIKLKNGMTVIIAENQATPKVYANLSFETTYNAAQTAVQEVTTVLLNQELSAIDVGMCYNDKGFNLVAVTESFETALQTMYAYISAPGFTEVALVKAKKQVKANLVAGNQYFPESMNVENINKICLADVNRYYNAINNPEQTYLTIAGNITPAIAKTYTKKTVNMNQAKPIAKADKRYLAINY